MSRLPPCVLVLNTGHLVNTEKLRLIIQLHCIFNNDSEQFCRQFMSSVASILTAIRVD